MKPCCHIEVQSNLKMAYCALYCSFAYLACMHCSVQFLAACKFKTSVLCRFSAHSTVQVLFSIGANEQPHPAKPGIKIMKQFLFWRHRMESEISFEYLLNTGFHLWDDAHHPMFIQIFL